MHYKFKFQKEDKRINFDGTGISVSDIKDEILKQNGLHATSIDIALYDANGKGVAGFKPLALYMIQPLLQNTLMTHSSSLVRLLSWPRGCLRSKDSGDL